MTINTKNIVCPICKKKDTWRLENGYRPFCSERCKLIDLGDWAAEKHRITGEDDDKKEDNSGDE